MTRDPVDQNFDFEDVGLAVGRLDNAMKGHGELVVLVLGLSIRGPRVRGDDYLVTVRGEAVDGAPVVAFHGAFSLGDLFKGLSSRLSSGSLKWRPDEFVRQ